MQPVLPDVGDAGVQARDLCLGLAPVGRPLDLAGQGSGQAPELLQVGPERLRSFDGTSVTHGRQRLHAQINAPHRLVFAGGDLVCDFDGDADEPTIRHP